MNTSAIPEFVTMWMFVNLGALIAMGVISYISSIVVLDWMASLDKWIYEKEHKHELNDGLEADHVFKEPSA